MTRKGVLGMAKKGFGRFLAFAAAAGAVAAGVSYILQYKTFHKELEKDFREFEEDADEGSQTGTAQGQPDQEPGSDAKGSKEKEDASRDPRRASRSYISLASSRDKFKVAAKDMAHATKNVLKDAGTILSDTAHEAVSAAVDTAHMAIHTVKSKKEEFADSRAQKEDDSDLFEDEGFLDDDYVDDDALFDYDRLDGDDFDEASSFSAAQSEEEYDEDLLKDASEPAGAAPGAYEEAPEKTETTSIEEDTVQ